MVASPGAIRAGRAYVELFADDSKLVRGLRRAAARLRAFGATIRSIGLKLFALGGAALAPLLASVKTFTTMGDTLAKMSRRTGIAVETLSELSLAAELSGTDLATLEIGVRNMQRTIHNAGDGLKQATEALGDMGLTVKDLVGLNPEAQLKRIASALAGVRNPSERAALAMRIFGRSGTMLLPLLEGGAARMEALQDQARKLGLTISTQDAEAAAKFKDALATLWATIKRAVFAVGAALTPTLQELAEWVTKVVVRVTTWVNKNRGLVVTILKIAAGVAAAGAALIGFAAAVTGIAWIMAAVATAYYTLKAILVAILSPVGLIVIGLAAGAAAFLKYTETGRKALGWLLERFAHLKSVATESIGGIVAAFQKGDLTLAAKVVWFALKMVFLEGFAWLQDKWYTVALYFQRVWAGAVMAIEMMFAMLMQVIMKPLMKIAGWLQRIGINVPLLAVDMKTEDYQKWVRERYANRAGEIAEQRRAYDAERELAKRRIDEARAEWKAAIAEAKRPLKSPHVETIGAATGTVAEAARRNVVGARGTFSAFELRGLGAASFAERTAQATEQTARNTKRLVDQGEPEFD